MNTPASNDKNPTPDLAEDNAFFPSPYSLSQYTSPKTDYDGTTYPTPYAGNKKVLMIATDERYIQMQNGKFFSTGNHPVEMLLPMFHLDNAGFEIDVATLSGNPAKLEMWAMPKQEQVVLDTFQKYADKLKNPLKLADILENVVGENSPYAAVFIPGGHGVLAKIPHSLEVKKVLKWAVEQDKFIITLCHGPASLLAAAVDEQPENYIFKDYQICVFPDSLDKGANIDIGYMPGALPWLVGENLEKLGVEILNKGITGQCHRDRKLLTGDSPLASNNLGKLAAETLLAEVKD
ncbi:TPA: protein deglycase HchA [Acinetobacter baumannii]|uniref:glyoxalase III HchA n=1 Tax=Acinetobacter baumannii TaxID=470 RepID=UPI00028DB02B|nr:glyoxalase III HchA [Acinetobacter baumannii]AGQ07812.1 Putative intracellular protease/amidase [Acinetobacter baumannii BJAB0715]AIY36072.1 DJ-1/PfpI family protein [Acinetobacter baumannii LAC-4]AKQ29485.1 chaperone protein HchA [Acinetobacter baumannii]AMN02729.1 chaperone protein HchA [Acinetobacter baumannii]APO60304.1 protein deglycase HchA [Acinetobacter baumannii]